MQKQVEPLKTIIEAAAKIHGHLGPFLVLGVKMGEAALKKLGGLQKGSLRVKLKVPLQTPYSCLIDGVQTATQCTVGNRKLELENSDENFIAGYFKNEDSDDVLVIRVKPHIIEALMTEMAPPNYPEEAMEALAWKTAEKTEEELFSFR
ncbi:hypothetical protein DRO34_02715 [Candidatus Bathyarchaeota archaeon]|nr:MAG: hypothetical protein DRO34_02715 [Candidatus Bathyarchaeota archaeon]